MKSIIFSFLMILGFYAQAQDTNFVKFNTWSFDNYTIDASLITWDMYRQNYIGIPPTHGDANPFEQAIFDHVYKPELFPKGLCFGMDLMAVQMMRYGGYDGFCAPAFIYPGVFNDGPVDPNLREAISMQMGRQLGHRFLLHILDLISQAKNRDGRYAYAQFIYYQSKKEPVTISITKSITPLDGGHALLPYFAEDLGATKRIYVYDPNRCYHYEDDPASTNLEHKSWYLNRENFIEINASNGHWKFYMADSTVTPFGELWEGSPSSGGNLVVCPLSIMNIKDRLPQSLFADASEAIAKIFIFGKGVDLSQISTPDGRFFIDKSSNDLNMDSQTALRSIYPFIPINGGLPLSQDSKLYFINGEQHIDVSVKSNKDGYKVQFFSDKNCITVTSETAYKEVDISIRNFHGSKPEVKTNDNWAVITIQEYGNFPESQKPLTFLNGLWQANSY